MAKRGDKQTKQGAGASPRPVARRDDVRLATGRCPYCHEDVEAEDADGLACARCLARQHGSCWREARACAACGGRRALRARRTRFRTSSREPALPILGGAVAVSLLVLGAAGLVASGLRERAAETRAAMAQQAEELRRLEEAAAAARAAEAAELAHMEAALARRDAFERVDPDLERKWQAAEAAERRQAEEAEFVARSMHAAKHLVDRRQDAAALELYGLVLARRPDSVEALHNRAVVLLRLGEPSAAVADCKRALTLQSDYLRALVTRGNAQRVLGNYDAALADYDRAIARDPTQVEALNNRGVERARRGDLEGALADYERAVAFQPRDAALRLNRGAALERSGEISAAVDDYQAFLRYAPEHPRAATIRARVAALQAEEVEEPEELARLEFHSISCSWTPEPRGDPEDEDEALDPESEAALEALRREFPDVHRALMSER